MQEKISNIAALSLRSTLYFSEIFLAIGPLIIIATVLLATAISVKATKGLFLFLHF